MSTNGFETLEGRRLLSVTWVNRGRNDGFERFYGAEAPVARQIVDAAIADWTAAVPAAKLKLRITAANLEPRSWDPTTLGVTTGTSIRMDSDAAGEGWYFDKSLADNSEITQVTTPFAAEGSFAGTDFYSVVAHEIGHAMDFVDRVTPYREKVGRRWYTDVYHSNDENDLMAPVIPDGTRLLISDYDIEHTKLGRRMVAVAPPRTFEAAPPTAVAVAPAGATGAVRAARAGTAGSGGGWSAVEVLSEHRFGVLG